jgi:hypothetical protein
MNATAVNDAAIVVLIFISSPRPRGKWPKRRCRGYSEPQVTRLTPNRTEPLPGIFNILNEYREHKESSFAALMCVYRLVTDESHLLWRRYNSFG